MACSCFFPPTHDKGKMDVAAALTWLCAESQDGKGGKTGEFANWTVALLGAMAKPVETATVVEKFCFNLGFYCRSSSHGR
jgi:hypothetical protein